MKKLLLLLGSFLLSLTTYAAMNISKIDPPFWYTVKASARHPYQ